MRHATQRLLVLLLVVCPLMCAAAEPDAASSAASAPQLNLTWHTAAPSPFARVESPTAVVAGKLYLFGGFTDDLSASTQLDVYDPAADQWMRLKDMPTGVTHLNPAVDGNTIWLVGGFKGKHPGPVTAESWQYDIAADAWKAGPPLPQPRAGGGLEIVGRQLHYFGGYLPDRNTLSADHWLLSLDGGADWQRAADLPNPRGHLTTAALDGKIYALGGADGHDVTQVDLNYCHVFDPATGRWTAIASLPEGRSHTESSTFIEGGRILMLGGRSNSPAPRGVLNDLIQYDPAADRWSTIGSMPQPLMAPSAAIVAGRLVVIGGGLNNPLPLTATTQVATWPAGK